MGNTNDVHVIAHGLVDLALRRAVVAGETVRLSAIEVDLLRYLIDRSGEPVSRAELLREVWGYRESVRSRTVDTCVCRLRLRLERTPRAPAHLLTVSGGYTWNATLAPRVELPAPASVGRRRLLDDLRLALDGPARLVWIVGPPGIGKRHLVRLAKESGEFPELDDREGQTVRPLVDGRLLLRAKLANVADKARSAGNRTIILAVHDLSHHGDVVVQLGPLEPREALELVSLRGARTLSGSSTVNRRLELCERLGRVPLAIAVVGARLETLSEQAILDSMRGADLPSWADVRIPDPEDGSSISIAMSWGPWWSELDGPARVVLWSAALADDWVLLKHAAWLAGASLPGAADIVAKCVKVGFLRVELRTAQTLLHMDDACRAVALRNLSAEPETARALVERWLELARGEVSDLITSRREVDGTTQAMVGIARRMHPMFPRLCVDAVLVSASELLERGSLSRAREVFGAVSIGKLEPEQRVLLADQRLRLASLSGDAQGATRALTDVGPLLSEWQNGFWSARLALVERRPVRAVSLLLTACDRAPSEALSDVLLTLGSALYETGDFDGATARYQQAAAVAMERGEPSAALSAWVRLGAACLERGEFEQSRRFLEQAVGRRAELGDVREIGVALSNLGVVAHETGELGEATQLLDDAVSLLRKVEHRRFEGFALAARGLVALETGLTRKAARDLHLARRALVEVADPTYVAVVDARLGVLSWTLGAQDAAFEHLNCAALAFDARSITWGALGVRAVSARLKDGHWPDERPDSSFVRLLGRVIDNSDSINASG